MHNVGEIKLTIFLEVVNATKILTDGASFLVCLPMTSPLILHKLK